MAPYQEAAGRDNLRTIHEPLVGTTTPSVRDAIVALNAEGLILLAAVDSMSNYLAGFWRWVEMLANDDYEGALGAVRWPSWGPRTPEDLKSYITGFFGVADPWSVVVPNERLIGVINDAAEYQAWNEGGGWFMAQIPLTTEPADPKDDKIPLMGLASSFFLRPYQGYYVMEFEILHM